MTRQTDKRTKRRVTPKCDQCEELMINGVRCHETGCPNARKRYDHDREQWIQYVKCFNCGYEVELGEVCDCQTDMEVRA